MPNMPERTSLITVRSILLILQLYMISFNAPTLILYGSSIRSVLLFFIHSYIHFSISMNNHYSYHCSIRLMDLPLISWRGYAALSAMPPNCLLFSPTQRFSNNSCVAPFPFLTVTSFFIYSTINNLQLD
jgi:hypothetical protein